MGTIEKVISDLKAAGIEVVSIEDAYPLDRDFKKRNLQGQEIACEGKLLIEVACVVPIVRA